MKVQRLTLQNVRGFDKLDLELNGTSALVIGDNGDGKSTVLRSLAMGLCDESSSAALFRELPGDFIRHGSRDREATISVQLGRHSTPEYELVTKIIELDAFERVKQTIWDLRGARRKKIRNENEFPWEKIFAAGYGPGIRVQGTGDYEYYLAVDAVYPLFKYDAPLHNPELIVRRILSTYKRDAGSRDPLEEIKALLADLLELNTADQVDLGKTGIRIGGPWGEKEDLRSLGDGYRATVTWVLDVIAWWFVRFSAEKRIGPPTGIDGIVLVDEIEQHLHPRWQRNVVHLLRKSFPNIQFIATTHSPLVASGAENVPVHNLRPPRGAEITHPFGWLAEDVYQMMGLLSSRATPVQENINELKGLAAKSLHRKLDKKEESRMLELRRRLRNISESAGDPIELLADLDSVLETLRAHRIEVSRSEKK